MKKRMNNIYKIILLILCIGISSFGASGRKVQASWAKSGAMRHYLRKNAEERMEAEKEKLFRDFTEEDLDKLSELLKKLLYNIEDRNEE